MNDRNASTPIAAFVHSPGRKEPVPSGGFLMETRVVYALAVIAAALSTVALLVMVSLTGFVVSLAFRARRTPDSRRSTTDLQTSIADHFRANRPRTQRARGPAAGTDRRA